MVFFRVQLAKQYIAGPYINKGKDNNINVCRNKMEILKVSASEPDWQRERIIRGKYEPWKKLLHVIRRYQAITEQGFLITLLKHFYVLWFRFWSVVCGADIPLNSKLGGGLIMPHPNGIVIHPAAVIGPNCLIFQQVTIGTGSTSGLPKIGGHVDIDRKSVV